MKKIKKNKIIMTFKKYIIHILRIVKYFFPRGGIAAASAMVGVLFFSSCAPVARMGFDNRYDYSTIYIDPHKDELSLMLKSVYRVQTETRVEIEGEIYMANAAGIGTSLDHHLLVVPKHVVKIMSFHVVTPFGLIEVPIPEHAKIEEKSHIIRDDGSRIEVKIVYADEKNDFTILESAEPLTPFHFPIGNSDELRVGNAYMLIGNFQAGISVRIGHITQLELIRYGAKGEILQRNPDIFGFSSTIVEGDSGAPIMAIRDGKFELIGIVTFLIEPARGLGFGLKINKIAEHYREIVKTK